MNEHDELDPIQRRLGDIGSQPVPDPVRTRHLSAMATATPSTGTDRRDKRFGRVAVAAAAIVGFMAGSTGLAMAGALPGPAQGAAHDVLSVVQVDVPDRKGPPQRILDDPCKGPPPWALENRELETDREPTPEEQAAHSQTRRDCRGGRPDGVGKPDHAEKPHAADPCKGPPVWSGRGGGPTPDEQTAHRAGCPADVEETEATEETGTGEGG